MPLYITFNNSDLNNLPQLDVRPQTINHSHLDPDVNLPLQTNFKYYSINDFLCDNNIKNCLSYNHFSALHCNIRSINANFDHLSTMLSQLKHEFSIIALSETKIKVQSGLTLNIDLPGYRFLSQPSLSNAGGVGFYIKENISFHIRDDLSQATTEFETLWVEVQSELHQNLICGVLYRHPRGNVSSFITYISDTLEKINQENKICTLLGDFNFNLLNFETDTNTHEFINVFIHISIVLTLSNLHG